MEIVPGVHLLAGTVGGRPLQLALLRGRDRVVLLDTGCAGDPTGFIQAELAAIGLRLTDIDLAINTHCDLDHCGGNADLKAANPAVLLTCGTADRPLVEEPAMMWARRYNAYQAEHGLAYDAGTRDWIMGALGTAQVVDHTWRGGEELRLGPDWVVEIHHAPGHSAGHVVVHDPAHRLLLSGDAAHGAVYRDTAGVPALCPTYADVDAYRASLRYLGLLGAETLVGCHWPVRRGAAVAAFLAESEQFVDMAEAAVLAAVAAHSAGLTLAEIIPIVGPQLGAWPRAVDAELVYALAGHVRQLTAIGWLIQDGPAPFRYRLA